MQTNYCAKFCERSLTIDPWKISLLEPISYTGLSTSPPKTGGWSKCLRNQFTQIDSSYNCFLTIGLLLEVNNVGDNTL